MFRKSKKQVNYEPKVPNGLIAHTEKGYYLVKTDKRFRFVSDRAMESWKLKVVETSEDAMSKVLVHGLIGFRDGTLIRDISNSKIYLISEYKKLHVTNPDSLLHLGFSSADILEVSSKEANMHKEGPTLND